MSRLAYVIANVSAILLALYIAFARDLDRPYWAMFTIFIVSKPISGAVRSKAVYRLFGTILGASVAVALIPPLVQSPVLLCIAMCVWISACLYLSLLDRTPRSYAFLLAGYGAAIVGFSVVNTPGVVFDVAVARLEEIGLGAICAAVMHSVFFPQNIAKGLNGQIQRTLADCGRWISDSLSGAASAQQLVERRSLSKTVTNLQLLYTHLPFETSDAHRTTAVMRALQDRLSVILPRLASAEDGYSRLQAAGTISPEGAALMADVSLWARSESPDSREKAAELAARITALSDARTSETVSWRSLLMTDALFNLREVVESLQDSRDLAEAMRHPRLRPTARIKALIKGRRTRPLHRDRGVALLSAAAAVISTGVACLLWITGAWPEGGVAAQFAAIGCTLFATLDNPSTVLRLGIMAFGIALPVAAFYQFAVFPQIDGFVTLAAVILPIIGLLSYMQTFEKLEGFAQVLSLGFSGGIALQRSYNAEFATFINSNSAEIAGFLIALATNQVFRTIDPLWNAQRIARSGWRDLARFADPGGACDQTAWTSQMFDRMGLIETRLASLPNGRAEVGEIDPLRDLSAGLNVADLQAAEAALDARQRGPLRTVARAVSRLYRGRSIGRPFGDDAEFPATVDTSIAAVSHWPDSESKKRSLAALTSLRLNLAVSAEPFTGPEAV